MCTTINTADYFDPEAIQAMRRAFDSAWQSIRASGVILSVFDREEPTREAVAKKIIELARRGERDASRLRDGALATFLRPANLNRGDQQAGKHRYRIGQTVRFPSNRYYLAAAGDYEVVRQLPDNDHGELLYRIKSVREIHERVVKEGELEKAGPRHLT